jgi:hypothetical protein
VPLLGVIANRTPADAESKYQRAYTSTERPSAPASAPAPTGEPEGHLHREPSDADARR